MFLDVLARSAGYAAAKLRFRCWMINAQHGIAPRKRSNRTRPNQCCRNSPRHDAFFRHAANRVIGLSSRGFPKPLVEIHPNEFRDSKKTVACHVILPGLIFEFQRSLTATRQGPEHGIQTRQGRHLFTNGFTGDFKSSTSSAFAVRADFSFLDSSL